MKKFAKRLIIAILCLGMMIGMPAVDSLCLVAVAATTTAGAGTNLSGDTSTSPSAQPSVTPSQTPANSSDISSETLLKKARKSAREEIDQYALVMKAGTSESVQKKVDQIVKTYKNTIGSATNIVKGEGLTNEDAIDKCVEQAKEKIDAAVDTKNTSDDDSDDDKPDGPTSTSDFVLVGGNWVVPTVTYGQSTNIVLPVVNMGTQNLTDVLVTPVVGNTADEWPFVLDMENYTQTIPELPGKLNGQSDMDRRRELTWTLRARDDAKSGHYKLQFTLLYYVGTETESCTLTTYVNVIGASGSGSIENESTGSSTPRVIVTGFTTEPAQVYAGDTFKLTLHLLNTSKRTAVSNMLINISAPNDGTDADSSYAAFLPTSGSNSTYIEKIGRGASKDLTIEMTAKSDLSQKPYQIDVNMEFEDEDFSSFTSSADVSIPIHQDAKFDLSTPEVLPDSIAVGSESNIMFSIYNTGRLSLYNVKLKFEGDCVTGGETFLGKVEAGGTGNVDVMVTGAKATTDDKSVIAVLTYEDESGQEQRFEQPIKLTVTGGDEMNAEGGEFGEGLGDDYMLDDFTDVDYVDDEQGKSSKLPWIILGIVVVLIIVLIVVIKLVKRSKRKKEEKEMSTLLSDLEEVEREAALEKKQEESAKVESEKENEVATEEAKDKGEE